MLFYCLTVQPCLLAVVVVAVAVAVAVAVVVVVVVVGGGGGGGGGGDRKIPTDSHYPLMDIYLIKHLQRAHKCILLDTYEQAQNKITSSIKIYGNTMFYIYEHS